MPTVTVTEPLFTAGPHLSVDRLNSRLKSAFTIIKLKPQWRKMTTYIKISRKLTFYICGGRHTVLEKYTRGYILNEEDINNFTTITNEMKESLQQQRIHAEGRNYVYALVAGYPCELGSKEYRKICFNDSDQYIREVI